MRETTKNYRPFPIVRQVDCRISFGVMDESAKSDATSVEASDGGAFQNPRDSIDGVRVPSGKYVSLEENYWLLDGEFLPLPENRDGLETGWWSSVRSNEDCVFDENPVIRFTFASAVSTLGWTMYFDSLTNQYPTRMKITAYDADGNEIDSGIYENDSDVAVIQQYVGDYSSVEIEFIKTSEPMRRIRLTEIDFGVTKDYDRNSLGHVSLTYGVDLLSRSLPSSELRFTFDNSDKQYNLLNPDGVYQYLQEGQKISAKFLLYLCGCVKICHCSADYCPRCTLFPPRIKIHGW